MLMLKPLTVQVETNCDANQKQTHVSFCPRLTQRGCKKGDDANQAQPETGFSCMANE
jgi:hypothetical protein